LKPMNCPGHILIYKSELRSYKDLPLRLSELGTVYRYERSGVLHGLMRVRGFTQDDAHIFCTPEQMESEVEACVDFAFKVFETYGFDKYAAEVSTWDPDKSQEFSGEAAEWERATRSLEAVLKKRGVPYKVMKGEAAFYGPKIDMKLIDAIGRPWQLSTVQFDFNLPKKFDLEYVAEDGSRQRPVMIHRGAFGAFERMTAYLIEQYAGAFPTWLHPVQVIVIPITDEQHAYARTVSDRLQSLRLRVEVDDRSEKMQRKIRDGHGRKVPYMAIVGGREAESEHVNVRDRSNSEVDMSLESFASMVSAEVAERRR